MVLDRNDHVINLFELKFHKDIFVVNKSYASQIREKMSIFRDATKTRKYLSWVVISTFGLKHNQHSLGLIEHNLTMDILFEGLSG